MSLTSFPIQQFYQALMTSNDLETKLEGIIMQFKKKNMSMIYQTIVHIHQILISKLQPPLMKFNALMSTKIFFDLLQYPAIVLIQIYILPIIFQIAVFKTTKKSDQGVSLYFIQKGSKPTKQIKRLGFNFVLLAIEFIFASAQIKAFRVLQNEELEEQSNYKKISKALLMRGVNKSDKLIYYSSPNYFQQFKRVYVQKLKSFSPQNFVDFFKQIMRKQLNGQAKAQLDSKRLIMFGDVYITSPLINMIQQELNSIDCFQIKKNFLLLLNQLVRFGYIEAVFLINNCDFLFSIANQIAKVNGDKDLDQGRYIYPLIDQNPKMKKAFYLQFLKCIEIWAYSIPFNQNNDESDSKKICDFLKYQKKFKFPQNSNIHKYKSEMELYLKQNSQRNQKVIGLIQQRSHQQYSKKISSLVSLKGESKISSKKQKQKKTLNYKEFQNLILFSMQILEVIGYSEKSYKKDMKMLIQFQKNWKKAIEQLPKEQFQGNNFQILISQGDIVVQQIKYLKQIYHQFQDKKIDFITVQQRIDNILNNITNQKNQKSQISVVSKYTTRTQNGKRDIVSKISEAVKKQKSLTNSRYSQYSASVSNKQAQKSKQNILIKQKNNQQKTKRLQLSSKNPVVQQKRQKNLEQDQNIKEYGITNTSKKQLKHSFLSPRQSQSETELKKKVRVKNSLKYFQDNSLDDEINYSKAQFGKIQKQNSTSSIQLLNKQSHKNSTLKNSSLLKKDSVIKKKKTQKNSASESQKESLRNKKLNIISFNEGNSDFLVQTNEYGLIQQKDAFKNVIQNQAQEQTQKQKFISEKQQEKKISNLKISKNLQKISKMEKVYSSKQMSRISQKQKQYLSFTNVDLSESKQQKQKIVIDQKNIQKEDQIPQVKKCLLQQQDQIRVTNQINPMLQSYYNITQFQKKQDCKFKKAINTKGQIFNIREKYAMQGCTPIKISRNREKLSRSCKQANIMTTLSQKNAKKSIQLYQLQRQKNRIIQGLNLKIKHLQNQQKSFHNKLLKKDNSMRQISFKQYSERDKLNFKQDAQSNQCSFSNSSRDISLSRQIKKHLGETNQLNSTNSQIKQINCQEYDQYFKGLQDYNTKRNFLKNKCLLISNQQMELGCMSIKKDSFINFTLFITSKKYSLEDFQVLFENDHNLSISALPDKLYKVKVKKQEIINIKIFVQNIPYKIPKINITYKIPEIKGTIFKDQIIIPCGFNKICSFEEINAQRFKQMFTIQDIFVVNNFKISSKVFKEEKIKQIFPYFVLLKKSQERKQYGCQANYKGNIFFIKFLINSKFYCKIEAKNMTGQKKNIKFLQYLVATFKKVLQSIKL